MYRKIILTVRKNRLKKQINLFLEQEISPVNQNFLNNYIYSMKKSTKTITLPKETDITQKIIEVNTQSNNDSP